MGIDFNLVSVEIAIFGAAVTVLGEEETRRKWKEIAERYGRDKVYAFQFWDELKDPEVLCIENGWVVVKEFVKQKSDIYLFFELADESRAFLFRSGEQLADVLIESGCRDFYLVDELATFLISYNDSDSILAEGTAKEWLSHLKLAVTST